MNKNSTISPQRQSLNNGHKKESGKPPVTAGDDSASPIPETQKLETTSPSVKAEAIKDAPGKKPSDNRTEEDKPAAPPKRVPEDTSPSKIYVHDKFYQKLSFFKNLQAKKSLALDIEPDKIRYIVARTAGGEIQVKEWGIQKFPVEEKDRQKAMQIALENIKARVYKKGMEVAASIFSPEVSIRQILFPKMKNKKELEAALFNKNEEELKNFDEQSIWNYEILDEFEQDGLVKWRLLIVSAPQSVVNYYTQIFEKAGLTLARLIPRPAAIQKAYRKMVFRPGRDLIIDIEYDLTQMCFLKGGELEFIRNVSIGARNLEVSIRQQEQAPAANGDLPAPQETETQENAKSNVLRSRLLEKIKDLKTKQNPVLHTFFSEILRSLAFIQGRDINRYVERVFVTGYGIRKESLLPYLRTRLSLPLFVLAPQFTKESGRTMDFAEFYSTIGTASPCSRVFNLLPPVYKKRNIFRKLNVTLISIIIPLTLVLGYYSVKQNEIIRQKEDLVRLYQKQYEQLNPIEGQYLQVQKEIGIIRQKNAELQGFVKNRPPIIPVLKLFSNETPKSIRFEKIVFTRIGEKDQSVLDKFRNDYVYKIDVEGKVFTDPLLGDVTLINYINRIIKINYFKNVQMLNKIKEDEQNTIRFTIRMYL